MNIDLFISYLVSWLISILFKFAFRILRQSNECLLKVVVESVYLLENKLHTIIFLLHSLSQFIFVHFSTQYLVKVCWDCHLITTLNGCLIARIEDWASTWLSKMIKLLLYLFVYFFLDNLKLAISVFKSFWINFLDLFKLLIKLRNKAFGDILVFDILLILEKWWFISFFCLVNVKF